MKTSLLSEIMSYENIRKVRITLKKLLKHEPYYNDVCVLGKPFSWEKIMCIFAIESEATFLDIQWCFLLIPCSPYKAHVDWFFYSGLSLPGCCGINFNYTTTERILKFWGKASITSTELETILWSLRLAVARSDCVSFRSWIASLAVGREARPSST